MILLSWGDGLILFPFPLRDGVCINSRCVWCWGHHLVPTWRAWYIWYLLYPFLLADVCLISALQVLHVLPWPEGADYLTRLLTLHLRDPIEPADNPLSGGV